jgi:hypothetical protein
MVSDLVFDVGMNDGADTVHYLSRGFRVIAVEADPVLSNTAIPRARIPRASDSPTRSAPGVW